MPDQQPKEKWQITFTITKPGEQPKTRTKRGFSSREAAIKAMEEAVADLRADGWQLLTSNATQMS